MKSQTALDDEYNGLDELNLNLRIIRDCYAKCEFHEVHSRIKAKIAEKEIDPKLAFALVYLCQRLKGSDQSGTPPAGYKPGDIPRLLRWMLLSYGYEYRPGDFERTHFRIYQDIEETHHDLIASPHTYCANVGLKHIRGMVEAIKVHIHVLEDQAAADQFGGPLLVHKDGFRRRNWYPSSFRSTGRINASMEREVVDMLSVF